MKRGYKVSMLLGTIGFIIICYMFLNPVKYFNIFFNDIFRYPVAWISFSCCGIIGITISYLFIEVT